jgi:Peptidase family S41
MKITSTFKTLALAGATLMQGCTQGNVSPSGTASDAVASTSNELRDVRRNEGISDFQQVVSAFDALYAPLQRKKARYGFSLEGLNAFGTARIVASTNDSDTFRATRRFLDAFQDGHVSYSPSVLSDSSREIFVPLLVAPFEGKYLVYGLGPSIAAQVTRGDELLRIDGKTPQELNAVFDRFESVANPQTTAQLVAFSVTFRSFFLPANLLPTPGTVAVLEFAKPDGTRYTVQTPWTSSRPPPRNAKAIAAPAANAPRRLMNDVGIASDTYQRVIAAKGELGLANDIGRNRPFFFNNAVQQTFGFTPVRPTQATLQAFEVPLCGGTNDYACYQSFAATYTFQGKRVLLVRIPSYSPSVEPGQGNDSTYIKAILKDFQATNDVLVIDNTNNPGGRLFYALDVFSALITQPAINIGLAFKADRRTINRARDLADRVTALGPAFAVLAAKFENQALATEEAYDKRQPLAPLFPAVIFDDQGDERIPPDALVQWTKPVVVLDNELSFSSGDLFPLVFKTNNRGVLFGETTAGLGGSVEEVLTTTYTQASLRLTRSFFAPMTQANQIPFGNLVEDQGVAPDVLHPLTVADFRAGYIGYVTHFSQTAVGLIK